MTALRTARSTRQLLKLRLCCRFTARVFVQTPHKIGGFLQWKIISNCRCCDADVLGKFADIGLAPRFRQHAEIEAAQHFRFAKFRGHRQILEDHALDLVLVEILLLGEDVVQRLGFGEAAFEKIVINVAKMCFSTEEICA